MSGQSTGQIVLEVVGTVVGAYFGYPALGFAIGSLAGGLIFPPGIPDGPHLQDYQLNTSSYGGPIPVNYGTNRYAGMLIWDNGFQEREEEVTIAKKQSQKQFFVDRSFAFAFCKGQGQLARIWLDGKIWFDPSAGDIQGEDITIPPPVAQTFFTDEAAVEYSVLYLGQRSKQFTFYDGSEDQEQDPTMVAKQGAENVPAYRGLCYIVFTDFPLQEFGNRIPQIHAEITTKPRDACPKEPWHVPDDNPLGEVQQDEVGWDEKRGRVYEHDDSGDTSAERGLRVFSYPEMVQTGYRTDEDLLGKRYAIWLTATFSSGIGTGSAFVTGAPFTATGRELCSSGLARVGYTIPAFRRPDGAYGTVIDLQSIADHFKGRVNMPGSGFLHLSSTLGDGVAQDINVTTDQARTIFNFQIATTCDPLINPPDTGYCSDIGCRNIYDYESGFTVDIVFTAYLICAESAEGSGGDIIQDLFGNHAYFVGEAVFGEAVALPCVNAHSGDCLTCPTSRYDLRGVSQNGYLYLVHQSLGFPISLVHPDYLEEVASFYPRDAVGNAVEVRHMGFLQDNYSNVYMLGCSEAGHMFMQSELLTLAGRSGLIDGVRIDGVRIATEGRCTSAIGMLLYNPSHLDFPPNIFAFWIGLSSSVFTIYRGSVFSFQGQDPPTTFDGGGIGPVVSFDLATEFPEVGAGADVRIIGHEPASHMMIVIVQKPSVGYYIAAIDVFSLLYPDALVFTIYWRYFNPAPGSNYDPPYTISNIKARTFGIGRHVGSGSPTAGTFYLHSLNDGTIIEEKPFTCFDPPAETEGVQQFYDSQIQAIYVSQDAAKTNSPGLHYLGRVAGGTSGLDEIVADICQKCGLVAEDYDVSQLAEDKVHGYPINAISSGRSALEPLMVAYFFDTVESDFMLKFIKRGGASVATIVQRDLIALDGGDVLPETRVQEIDLPERVVVNFSDYYRDYLSGTQSSKRIVHPYPTQYSGDQLTMQLPLALSPTKAKRIADITAYVAWSNRNRERLKTPWKHLALDPADLVTVTLDDGRSYFLRLLQNDVGLDFIEDFQAVEDDPSTYVSTVIAAQALGSTQPTPQGIPTDVMPLILDATLLRDMDDGGGAADRYYQTVIPLKPDNFLGGGIMRSADGLSYTLRGTFTAAPPQGTLQSYLPACETPFTILEDAYVDVKLSYGSAPVSVSEIDFLAGRNTAAVVTPDGDTEWIQFRDVEDLGDDIVRLSYLLRGRRGSEQFCGDHGFADRVVFVNVDGANPGISLDSIDLGKVGSVLYFASAKSGQSLDEAQKTTERISGSDLKPYAPVHLALDVNGDGVGGNIISWVRRTRIGGVWRNSTPTVFVGETELRFEVDILDAAGIVLRTLTAVNASEVSYDASDFAADFPDGADTIDVVVYQISASVGRGFPAAETLSLL